MLACTMSGFGLGMWPLGMVLMLGFWGLVIWLGVRLYRGGTPRRRGAEHTLAARFAAGDIGEDEYRARLEVLRDERSAADWGLRL